MSERAREPLLPAGAEIDLGRRLQKVPPRKEESDQPRDSDDDAGGNGNAGKAATGGAINEAQNFSVFELKQAAEFAAAKNADGFNLYIGPALRHGKQPGDGRANDSLVLTAQYSWAEFDGAGDDETLPRSSRVLRRADAWRVAERGLS